MKFSTLAVIVWSTVVPSCAVGFAPPLPPAAIIVPGVSSVTISSTQSAPSAITIDKVMLKSLEQETKAAEKEAKADERKAKVEKSRDAFFEYEAKMAAEQEARIEAAEQKAEEEVIKDKAEEQRLLALEKKAEEDAALAKSKDEKAAKLKEAKKLLAKEKALERKEKAAERAEKIFLAEETQEKKILQAKLDAKRAVSIIRMHAYCVECIITSSSSNSLSHTQEDEKFERVEKEYKRAAEVAREEEAELRLAKKMYK